MDNQQERLTSWFAGILDGEGSISAQVYTLPDGRVRITPFLCVVNSDNGILESSLEWLKWAATGRAQPRICGHVGTNRPCTTIRLDGDGIKPVLQKVLPELRSDQKRRNAQVILQYLESRHEGLLKRDGLGRILRTGYTRAEVELISSIRTHTMAKSSEAICQAPNVIG